MVRWGKKRGGQVVNRRSGEAFLEEKIMANSKFCRFCLMVWTIMFLAPLELFLAMSACSEIYFSEYNVVMMTNRVNSQGYKVKPKLLQTKFFLQVVHVHVTG